MLGNYPALGIFFILTLAFPIGAMAAAWLFRPKPQADPADEKYTTYECGVDTKGKSWIRFKVNYFLYALVFLIFDIETVFLYPWAVKFKALGPFAFVEMIIFIAILVVGLWYAWKEGALEWH
ncbi:MAG TPA: NADH-quinone oxidoreductase subunit A [Syntrophomonadaceae bacterium]|nr:NADH-quinone oxidoreductase subunit A [Syntrophomonadaceae bacterium]HPR93535.1 NADH-quinone oxidoreductase subunit A [Syntrophomonadaceae bacterium]